MKKSILGYVLMLLLVCTMSLAFNIEWVESSEPPLTEWTRTYGGTGEDTATSMILTSDGGFAIAGATWSFGAGCNDFWLVKTDASGDLEWNQTYGGTNRDAAHTLVETSDGGYALAGNTWSFGAGGWDVWLVEVDSSGEMQWNEVYGGTDDEYVYSMIETSDGGYALAGYTRSLGAGGFDFWLVKTDSAGNTQWNQTYGGLDWEQAFSMIETSDGGYALAGYTKSFGAGSYDFWLVKTNASGNMQWNQTYGGTNDDIARSAIQTTDGGYAIAGYTKSLGAGGFDFWLVKTDSAGNTQWNQTYGGTNDDHGYSLVQTRDSGFAMAGDTWSWGAGESDFCIIETDTSGNPHWSDEYGGPYRDEAFSVIQTTDGGYAIAGYTKSFGDGDFDFWLIKLAPEEIAATIDINPNTLNLKSKGKWITCYTELLEGYDVSDIDVSTILLNDTVPAESHPTEVGDYDGDGVPDLMVKFDRASVIDYITEHMDCSHPERTKPLTYEVTLTVTGTLYDGTPFEGSDTIRVLKFLKGHPIPA